MLYLICMGSESTSEERVKNEKKVQNETLSPTVGLEPKNLEIRSFRFFPKSDCNRSTVANHKTWLQAS